MAKKQKQVKTREPKNYSRYYEAARDTSEHYFPAVTNTISNFSKTIRDIDNWVRTSTPFKKSPQGTANEKKIFSIGESILRAAGTDIKEGNILSFKNLNEKINSLFNGMGENEFDDTYDAEYDDASGGGDSASYSGFDSEMYMQGTAISTQATIEAVSTATQSITEAQIKASDYGSRRIVAGTNIAISRVLKYQAMNADIMNAINQNMSSLVESANKQESFHQQTLSFYERTENYFNDILEVMREQADPAAARQAENDKYRRRGRRANEFLENGFDPGKFVKSIWDDSMVGMLGKYVAGIAAPYLAFAGIDISKLAEGGIGGAGGFDGIRPLRSLFEATPIAKQLHKLNADFEDGLKLLFHRLGQGEFKGILGDISQLGLLGDYRLGKSSSINLGDYDKGVARLTGKSLKAIETVIPTYLSNIENDIATLVEGFSTGQFEIGVFKSTTSRTAEERRENKKYFEEMRSRTHKNVYSYEEGRFRNYDEFAANYQDDYDSLFASAFGPVMDKVATILASRDKKEREALNEMLNELFEEYGNDTKIRASSDARTKFISTIKFLGVDKSKFASEDAMNHALEDIYNQFVFAQERFQQSRADFFEQIVKDPSVYENIFNNSENKWKNQFKKRSGANLKTTENLDYRKIKGANRRTWERYDGSKEIDRYDFTKGAREKLEDVRERMEYQSENNKIDPKQYEDYVHILELYDKLKNPNNTPEDNKRIRKEYKKARSKYKFAWKEDPPDDYEYNEWLSRYQSTDYFALPFGIKGPEMASGHQLTYLQHGMNNVIWGGKSEVTPEMEQSIQAAYQAAQLRARIAALSNNNGIGSSISSGSLSSATPSTNTIIGATPVATQTTTTTTGSTATASSSTDSQSATPLTQPQEGEASESATAPNERTRFKITRAATTAGSTENSENATVREFHAKSAGELSTHMKSFINSKIKSAKDWTTERKEVLMELLSNSRVLAAAAEYNRIHLFGAGGIFSDVFMKFIAKFNIVKKFLLGDKDPKTGYYSGGLIPPSVANKMVDAKKAAKNYLKGTEYTDYNGNFHEAREDYLLKPVEEATRDMHRNMLVSVFGEEYEKNEKYAKLPDIFKMRENRHVRLPHEWSGAVDEESGVAIDTYDYSKWNPLPHSKAKIIGWKWHAEESLWKFHYVYAVNLGDSPTEQIIPPPDEVLDSCRNKAVLPSVPITETVLDLINSEANQEELQAIADYNASEKGKLDRRNKILSSGKVKGLKFKQEINEKGEKVLVGLTYTNDMVPEENEEPLNSAEAPVTPVAEEAASGTIDAVETLAEIPDDIEDLQEVFSDNIDAMENLTDAMTRTDGFDEVITNGFNNVVDRLDKIVSALYGANPVATVVGGNNIATNQTGSVDVMSTPQSSSIADTDVEEAEEESSGSAPRFGEAGYDTVNSASQSTNNQPTHSASAPTSTDVEEEDYDEDEDTDEGEEEVYEDEESSGNQPSGIAENGQNSTSAAPRFGEAGYDTVNSTSQSTHQPTHSASAPTSTDVEEDGYYEDEDTDEGEEESGNRPAGIAENGQSSASAEETSETTSDESQSSGTPKPKSKSRSRKVGKAIREHIRRKKHNKNRDKYTGPYLPEDFDRPLYRDMTTAYGFDERGRKIVRHTYSSYHPGGTKDTRNFSYYLNDDGSVGDYLGENYYANDEYQQYLPEDFFDRDLYDDESTTYFYHNGRDAVRKTYTSDNGKGRKTSRNFSYYRDDNNPGGLGEYIGEDVEADNRSSDYRDMEIEELNRREQRRPGVLLRRGVGAYLGPNPMKKIIAVGLGFALGGGPIGAIAGFLISSAGEKALKRMDKEGEEALNGRSKKKNKRGSIFGSLWDKDSPFGTKVVAGIFKGIPNLIMTVAGASIGAMFGGLPGALIGLVLGRSTFRKGGLHDVIYGGSKKSGIPQLFGTAVKGIFGVGKTAVGAGVNGLLGLRKTINDNTPDSGKLLPLIGTILGMGVGGIPTALIGRAGGKIIGQIGHSIFGKKSDNEGNGFGPDVPAPQPIEPNVPEENVGNGPSNVFSLANTDYTDYKDSGNVVEPVDDQTTKLKHAIDSGIEGNGFGPDVPAPQPIEPDVPEENVGNGPSNVFSLANTDYKDAEDVVESVDDQTTKLKHAIDSGIDRVISHMNSMEMGKISRAAKKSALAKEEQESNWASALGRKSGDYAYEPDTIFDPETQQMIPNPNAIPNNKQSAFDMLRNGASNFVNSTKNGIRGVMNGITDIISTGLGAAATMIFGPTVGPIVSSVASGLGRGLNIALPVVGGLVIGGTLISKFFETPLGKQVKESAINLFDKTIKPWWTDTAKPWLLDRLDDVKGFVDEQWPKVEAWIGDTADKLTTAFLDAVPEIVEGIKNGVVYWASGKTDDGKRKTGLADRVLGNTYVTKTREVVDPVTGEKTSEEYIEKHHSANSQSFWNKVLFGRTPGFSKTINAVEMNGIEDAIDSKYQNQGIQIEKNTKNQSSTNNVLLKSLIKSGIQAKLIFGGNDQVTDENSEIGNKYQDMSVEDLAVENEGYGSSGSVGYGSSTSDHYSQLDKTWRNIQFGKTTGGKTTTIGSGGCGPTALANVARSLTGNKRITPTTVANMAQDYGYTANGGSAASLFTEGANRLGLSSQRINVNDIPSRIAAGQKVIVSGKKTGSNSPYTSAGHIISLNGVKGGKAVVDDPLKSSSETKNIRDVLSGARKAWVIGKGNEGYGSPEEYINNMVSMGYGVAALLNTPKTEEESTSNVQNQDDSTSKTNNSGYMGLDVSGNLSSLNDDEIVNASVTPYNITARKNTPDYVVIHYTAGRSSASGNALSLANGYNNNPNVSSDFTVDDSTVVQYNPNIKGYYTWGIGGKPYSVEYTSQSKKYLNSTSNGNVINVEVLSNLLPGFDVNSTDHDGWYFTPETLTNTARLTKYLMHKYGIPYDRVIMHHQATGKACPAMWTNREENLFGWDIFQKMIGNPNITLPKNPDRLPGILSKGSTNISTNLSTSKSNDETDTIEFDKNLNGVYKGTSDLVTNDVLFGASPASDNMTLEESKNATMYKGYKYMDQLNLSDDSFFTKLGNMFTILSGIASNVLGSVLGGSTYESLFGKWNGGSKSTISQSSVEVGIDNSKYTPTSKYVVVTDKNGKEYYVDVGSVDLNDPNTIYDVTTDVYKRILSDSGVDSSQFPTDSNQLLNDAKEYGIYDQIRSAIRDNSYATGKYYKMYLPNFKHRYDSQRSIMIPSWYNSEAVREMIREKYPYKQFNEEYEKSSRLYLVTNKKTGETSYEYRPNRLQRVKDFPELSEEEMHKQYEKAVSAMYDSAFDEDRQLFDYNGKAVNDDAVGVTIPEGATIITPSNVQTANVSAINASSNAMDSVSSSMTWDVKVPNGMPLEYAQTGYKMTKVGDGSYDYIDDPGIGFAGDTAYSKISNAYGPAAIPEGWSSVERITLDAFDTNKYDAHTLFRDVRKFPPINADKMNELIPKLTSSEVYQGQGQTFIDASNISGIDPRFLLVQSGIESDWGRSDLATRKANYFGITAYDGSAYSSGTSFVKNGVSDFRTGILNGAQWLSRNHVNRAEGDYIPKAAPALLGWNDGHIYGIGESANGTPLKTAYGQGIAKTLVKTEGYGEGESEGYGNPLATSASYGESTDLSQNDSFNRMIGYNSKVNNSNYSNNHNRSSMSFSSTRQYSPTITSDNHSKIEVEANVNLNKLENGTTQMVSLLKVIADNTRAAARNTGTTTNTTVNNIREVTNNTGYGEPSKKTTTKVINIDNGGNKINNNYHDKMRQLHDRVARSPRA